MNLNQCPKEASLLAALANNSLTDDLIVHLETCAVCQDAQLVWSYLRETANVQAQAELPSPGILWWKAQLAKKRAATGRSVALIEIMQKIAVAVAILMAVAVGAWQGAKLMAASPMLLAGSAAVLVLFLASIVVVLGLARDSHRRTLPRGM